MIFGFSSLSFCAMVAAAAFAMGGATAWKVQGWRYDAQKAEALAEAQRMNAKRESVSTTVEKAHVAKEAKQRTIIVTQIREVERFVPVSDCPLSPGFRVYHDAAAEGVLPDTARIPDAAAVTPKEAATTIAENYDACRTNATRLESLQKWVLEQQKVH